ncbi:MAG: TrbG/VirB9 family P-type conjugative transfer protein [Candidatus Lariskella arthropodorum]
MREYSKIFFVICFLSVQFPAMDFAHANKPITTDSRIKTFVYSENEVFRIVLNYGYQTSLEFADGEEINTISVGNNYAWQLSPVGRRLFIKPLEDDILTNMTIITNKRTYQFELQSKLPYGAIDDELVYVVRFFYPDEYQDTIKPQLSKVRETDTVPAIRPYNFNYSVNGSNNASTTKVFDDGIKTFFYFGKYSSARAPVISSKKDGRFLESSLKKVGKYFVVNTTAAQFRISLDGEVAEVTNNEFTK